MYVFFFLWGKNILRQGYIKIKQLSKEKEIINSLKVNSPLNFFKNNNIKINGNKCFENLINFDIVIQECITINKKNNANSFLKLNNINNLKDNNNLTFSKILKGMVVDKKKKEYLKIKGNTTKNNKNINIIHEIDSLFNIKKVDKNKNQTIEVKQKSQMEIERDFRPKKIITNKKHSRSPFIIRKKGFKLNNDNMNFDEFLPKKAIHKDSTPGIIGLYKNLDICYMNAVIQCFSNIKSLRIELLNQNNFQYLEKNKKNKQLSYALAFEFKNLWQILNHKSFSANVFKKKINEIYPFLRGIQNDPIKLIQFILIF